MMIDICAGIEALKPNGFGYVLSFVIARRLLYIAREKIKSTIGGYSTFISETEEMTGQTNDQSKNGG